MCAEGYAKIMNRYGSEGLLSAVCYYDPEGRLVLTPEEEYAYIETVPFPDLKYFEEEDPVKASPKDSKPKGEEEDAAEEANTEMEKAVRSRTNHAQADDNAGMAGLAFWVFDTENRLMTVSDGYACGILLLDEMGQTRMELFYDEQENPATLSRGYAICVWNYDEDGNQVSEAYFDPLERKTLCREGYHAEEREFDEFAQITAIRYLDCDGAPVLTTNGYALLTRTWDEAGFMTREAYFDTKGKPALNSAGYHRVDYTWDPMSLNPDQASGEAYFDLEGRPAALADGCVRLERDFDEEGNLTRERRYDAAGNLISAPVPAE